MPKRKQHYQRNIEFSEEKNLNGVTLQFAIDAKGEKKEANDNRT